MKYSLLITAAALLAIGGYAAQASCVHRTKAGDAAMSQHVKLPPLPPVSGERPSRDTDSIVGLWHVSHYLPDGSLYFESFEQYHGDGTEFEFANINPIVGDICMGVYSQVDSRNVSLYHIGWIFDDVGNPAGTFTLEGPRTVTKRGAHLRGTFDAKIYDVNGNLVEEDTGTTVGDRIPQ